MRFLCDNRSAIIAHCKHPKVNRSAIIALLCDNRGIVRVALSFHRIFGFPLNRRSHGVIELKIHLEGQNKVYYMGKETAEQMDHSMFLLENSDSDNLAENDLVIFETAILWVVQMTLRDKSSLAQRRIGRVAHLEKISEECDIINEELSKTKSKLGVLMVDNYEEDSWQNRQSLEMY
ncbi:hypothetical protein Ddc_19709 [Ditylenchus destructor]|nr:hypothetical protein Ddc_19709 [Ditylenchus destructor]